MPLNKKSTIRLNLEGNAKQKTESITNSAEDLKQEFEKVDRVIDKIDKVRYKNLQKSLDAIKDKVKKTGDRFTLLKGSISSLAGNLGSDFVSSVIEAGKAIFELGVETNATKVRVIALANSAKEGEEQWQRYIDIANKFGIAFQPLAEIGTQLKIIGLEAGEAEKILEQLTIAAGGSTDRFEGLALAFQQMKTGKVELEELNQVAERGVPIFQDLANVLGITTKKLRDEISAGNVTLEDFTKALDEYTKEGGKARIAAEATAGTIKASITRLQTAFGVFSEEVVSMFETDIKGAVKFATDALGEFQKELKNINERGEIREFRRQIGDESTWEGIGQKLFQIIDPITRITLAVKGFLAIREGLFTGATFGDLETQLVEKTSRREKLLKEIAALESKNSLFAKSQLRAKTKQVEKLDEEIENLNILLLSLNNYDDGIQRVARGIGEINTKSKIVVRNTHGYDDAIKRVAAGLGVVETKLGLSTEQYKKQNKLQKAIEKIESDRKDQIAIINKQVELGIITETEGKQKIEQLNKQTIADNITIGQEIQNFIDELVDPKARDLWQEHYDSLIKKTQTLITDTGTLTDELKEAADELLRNQRFAEQGGKFITSEDRVKGAKGGGDKNLGDELFGTSKEQAKKKEEELDAYNTGIRETVDLLNQGVDIADDLGSIFNNIGNQELQRMIDNFNVWKEMNEQQIQKIETDHQKELKRIDDEFKAGKITLEEKTRLEKKANQDKINGVNKLKEVEKQKQKEIAQKEYDLAMQNFHWTQSLRYAEAIINTVAGALSAAASNRWIEFGLIVAGGLFGIGKIASTPAPQKPTALAEGGIVTGPTQALVGEAGPEIVWPLDKLEKLFMGMNIGGGVTNNYYNFEGITTPEEIIDALRDHAEEAA